MNILVTTKAILGRLWAQTDKLQLAGLVVAIISLWFVYYQLRENNKTNKVSIRGQLYEREGGMASDESSDEAKAFSTIWALTPTQISTDQISSTLLQLVTSDSTALAAKTPAELYHSMFDVSVFADKTRRDATQDIRRLFLFTQSNFYHIHNAFDYRRDEILSDPEWRTWKGLIREMHAHPMLLTVIWQGYQNRYFSRQFAEFLQTELCSDEIPSDVTDKDAFRRDREFVRLFYPEMTKKDWSNGLPAY